MAIQLLTAGESHGPALTAILAGMPAGIPVDGEMISVDLRRRQKATGAGERMAIEKDRASILAGVMEGKTTGAPIALLIPNADHKNWAGREVPAYTVPRPGHADLAALIKYGYDDIRPSLERASARETASRVAAGAICRAFLRAFGITVGGYVLSIGEEEADIGELSFSERVARARKTAVQTPDPEAGKRMERAIDQARQEGDTLGGVIEVAVEGLPIGLGSHVTPERRLDASLARAVLSVPAIKGFEIGDAFAMTRRPGTRVHDPILTENGKFHRGSDRCGGLEGGITIGEPLWFRAAMKPIPTTLKGIPTVDLATGEAVSTRYERSDICPVPRAVVVLEAVTAKVIADALIEKLGGDSLEEMLPRFAALARAKRIDASDHCFWPAR